ncbi:MULTISPECIES: response regulator transcription factor [unclassified Imperialibacter]|uniref:response regulator transcription factor n=1 Tax=unclassified Imperialibacter TaxID=2629706 RepID=UPI0012576D27|nr:MULTISPECIES: response regulator transcription factor [unclassified Imperialibacter]CAD5268535.1 Transcriptional regulatory protein RprY [Imperialibacter sp. 89]CAD5297005.1 Transcriptional regulatory protein RprY [Imperialibacter sp. 75]VVT33993.1 Transcriptional regulatory protein RprY [Imperialibacter sp. EC-SDR9]
MKNRPKLLLVEDDPSLGFVLKDNLEQGGYEVVHATNGLDAQKFFKANTFDLCLLDIMLPKVDGFTLAKSIRATNSSVPILFITARSLQEDKLKGFSIGADDYITKPFSMEELLFRVAVFVKRTTPAEEKPTSQLLAIGEYTLNTDTLRLHFKDGETKLTRRENDLLFMLVCRKNQLVKRDEILLQLWGDDDYFAGRSLDVFVSRLRKYLRHDPNVQIENHHSVGFQLRVK